jgi:hypothetical protein
MVSLCDNSNQCPNSIAASLNYKVFAFELFNMVVDVDYMEMIFVVLPYRSRVPRFTSHPHSLLPYQLQGLHSSSLE